MVTWRDFTELFLPIKTLSVKPSQDGYVYSHVHTHLCSFYVVWHVRLLGCMKLYCLQFAGKPREWAFINESDAAKIRYSLQDKSTSLYTVFVNLRYSLFQERERLLKGVKCIVLSPFGWGLPGLGLRHFSGALCQEGALACCSSVHTVFECRGVFCFQINSLSSLVTFTL